MSYNLLAVTAAKIGESALYALLGFAIVFFGISFLILVIWLVGKFMSSNQKTSKEKVEKPVVKKEEPVIVAAQPKNDEVSEETLAVITAAVMAYYENNHPKCEFTVRRIKKI